MIARVVNLLENKKQREKETAGNEQHIHKEDKFLTKLRAIISVNISDPNFGVLELLDNIDMSEKQLTRTLKTISGLTPLKFIREIKLLKAEELLKNKVYTTVAEVCYTVGFEKPSYFTSLYFKRFGKKPSSYF